MKKRILMISPVPSHPITAGNRARIFMLGSSIKKLGHDFYFAHLQRELGDKNAMENAWGREFFFQLDYTRPNPLHLRIKKKLRSFFDKEAYFKYDIDAWYDSSIDANLTKLYRDYKFDVVIVEYVFFSKALLCFPKEVLKVVDTHDVFTDRDKIYTDRKIEYFWFSTTASQERKGLNRADVIVAIQHKEAEFFERLTGKNPITVGHLVDLKKPKEKSELNRILFVGSQNTSNIDAIQFFISDIFPRVKKWIKTATLIVAGKVCDSLKIDISDVELLGEIVELASLYDRVDIVVNPIRMGTGLKIKNIEALGYGKPLVTTSIGAVGLECKQFSGFSVADNADDFAEEVIRLLKDQEIYNHASENAFRYAGKWNLLQTDSIRRALEKK